MTERSYLDVLARENSKYGKNYFKFSLYCIYKYEKYTIVSNITIDKQWYDL